MVLKKLKEAGGLRNAVGKPAGGEKAAFNIPPNTVYRLTSIGSVLHLLLYKGNFVINFDSLGCLYVLHLVLSNVYKAAILLCGNMCTGVLL
jgi:hypothetical protein